MVEVPKNTTQMFSSAVKPEDVIVEHAGDDVTVKTPAAPRRQKEDPLAEMRKNQESAERALAEEKERRQSVERELSAARAQVTTTRETLAKSEIEKVATQEAAITSRLDAAKAEVENAERALEEAIDTGKPAKEQISLQKNLAEAVYKMKGAEGAKTHFENWKEREKSKPAPKQDDSVTPKAKEWIDSHPRFNTDKKYRRVAVAAHEDAVEDGVAADSTEYFRRINTALAEAGLEGGGSQDVHAVAPKTKPNSATSTGAPVSHDSTMAGARGGTAAEEQRTGRKTFKLDGNMREQALKIYGKNSTFKLSDDEAYKRYAARQIEIREKRANGENI